jgi:hypothetical protein
VNSGWPSFRADSGDGGDSHSCDFTSEDVDSKGVGGRERQRARLPGRRQLGEDANGGVGVVVVAHVLSGGGGRRAKRSRVLGGSESSLSYTKNKRMSLVAQVPMRKA